MKSIVIMGALLIGSIAAAQPATKTAPGKPGAKVTATPAPQISREKAWEYLTLTHRQGVMEKAYKARYVDGKGAKAPSEALRKKHLEKLNNILVAMVQKSFSPLAMDSVLAFLKTPGGERWAEDASEFNDDFRDEINEAWTDFADEIKEANEAAAESKAAGAPAAVTAPAPKAALPPAPAPFGH